MDRLKMMLSMMQSRFPQSKITVESILDRNSLRFVMRYMGPHEDYETFSREYAECEIEEIVDPRILVNRFCDDFLEQFKPH